MIISYFYSNITNVLQIESVEICSSPCYLIDGVSESSVRRFRDNKVLIKIVFFFNFSSLRIRR